MVAVLVMTACHKKSETEMSGGALPVEVALPAVQELVAEAMENHEMGGDS